MSDISELARKVRVQLTAPGAPFEVVEQTVNGRALKHYRNAFPSLPALIAASRTYDERPFIVFQDEVWSYARLFREADALAAQMRVWGIAPGDRVAIAMRNRPEWAVAFVAAAMLGAVPAPLNSFGLGEELHAALEDVAPRAFVCDAERLARIGGDPRMDGCRVVCVGASDAASGVTPYQDAVAQTVPATPVATLSPGDPALILFTSGATSRAKGVLSSQRAVCQALFNIDYIAALSGMTSPEAVAAIMAKGIAPATLTAVPLFHVSGLHAQLLTALRNGRRLVFMPRWDPAEAIRLIREQRVTQFNGAPSMVMQLLSEPGFDDPVQTGTLAALGFGGAGLPQGLIGDVLARRPDSMSGIGFGLTETNGVGSAASGQLFTYKPRSSGVLSPIVDVKIVGAAGETLPPGEAGEICLSGVTVMDGYWHNAAATEAAMDGRWFRSGDVGYVDDEGFLFVVDRIKDVINRCGEKIAAAEVESCLLMHPDVLEAAVFSVPDADTGEAVAAFVSLRDGARPDLEGLRVHVAAHLAGYKVPALIEVVHEALPRNPAGKLLKAELRRRLSTGAQG